MIKNEQKKLLAKRRLAWALALTFIFSNQGPLIVGLAAPSVFVRPQLGVSRSPLNVMSFGDAGFGEVADAINVANGNLFVSGANVAKNNTPSGEAQNANTIGGSGWSTKSRMRLNGFQANLVTAPTSLSLELGDQSTIGFKKVSSVNFEQSPTWIQRYQNVAAGAWTFYALQSQPGVSYQAEWIALRTGSSAIAHYYDASGVRYSFFQDGEYADYWQTPDQQFRNAQQGLTEGKPYNGQTNPFASGSGALNEISYDSTTGRISKISDEYGRVTKYEWNTNQTLRQINELLSDENNADTYARRTDFQYITAQNLISSITYTARDGQGATIARTTGFEYDGVGRITRIKRGAVSGQKITTYTYDPSPDLAHLIRSVAIRDSSGVLLEPETFYQYSSNNTTLLATMPTTSIQVESLQQVCKEKSRVVNNDGQNDKHATVLGCTQDAALFRVPNNVISGQYQIKLRANAKMATVVLKRNNQRIAKREWATEAYQTGNLAKTTLKAGDRISISVLDTCANKVNCQQSTIRVDQLELQQVSLRLEPQQGQEIVDAKASQGKSHLVNHRFSVSVPNNIPNGYYRIRVKAKADEVTGTPSLDLVQNNSVVNSVTLQGKKWNTLDLGAVNLESGQPIDLQFASARTQSLGSGKNLKVDFIELSRITTSAAGSKVLTITQGDQVQTYELDLFNRLRKRILKDTNPVSGATRDLVWTYQYYKNGNVALEVEPSGRSTHYAYDADGLLLRRTTYRSNPFAEGYTPQISAGLTFRDLQDLNNDAQPDRVFYKGQTVKVAAAVRYDYARQGVEWKLQDENGIVLYNSVTPVPSQNNYQFTVEPVSDIDSGGVYTVRAEFKAPNFAMPSNPTSSSAFTKTFKLIAITRNNNIESEATFTVASQIKGIRFDNFPTELVIAPDCVQTSVQYVAGNGCGVANAPMSISLNGQAIVNEYFPSSNTGLVWTIQQAPGSGFSILNNVFSVPYDSTLLSLSNPTVNLQACSVAEPSLCAQIPIKLRLFKLQGTNEFTNPIYRWDNDSTITSAFTSGVPSATQAGPKFEGSNHNKLFSQDNKQLAVQAVNVPQGYAPPIQWSVSDWYHYMNNDYYHRFDAPNNQPLHLGFPYSYTNPDLPPAFGGLGRPYSEYSGSINDNGCFRAPLVGWDGAFFNVRRESRFIKVRASVAATNQSIENWIRVDFRDINYNPSSIPGCAGGLTNGLLTGAGITYAQPGAGGGGVRPQEVSNDAAAWSYSYGDISANTPSGNENPLAADNQPDFDNTVKPGFATLELMAYDQHRRVTSAFSANDTSGLSGSYTGTEQRNTFGTTLHTDTTSVQKFEVLISSTAEVRVDGTVTESPSEPRGFTAVSGSSNVKRSTTTNLNTRGLPTSTAINWKNPSGVQQTSTSTMTYASTDTLGNPTTLESKTLPTPPSVTAVTALQYPDQIKQSLSSTTEVGQLPGSVTQKVQKFVYDALGNVVKETLEGIAADVTVTTSAEIAATNTNPKIPTATIGVTPTLQNKVIERAFNGFNQTVWQKTTLQDSTDAIKNIGSESGSVYAATGELLREWNGNFKNSVIYKYNSSNRIEQIQRGIGNGTWNASSTLTTIRQELNMAYDSFGRVTTTNETNQPVQKTEYDSLNRVVRVTKPDASKVETQYDIHGQANNEKIYKKDGAVRRTTTTERDSLGYTTSMSVTGDSSPSYTLTYTNDSLGRIRSITHSDISINPNVSDRTISMRYDIEGNQIYQNGMTMRGESSFMQDQRRPASAYEFDALNRKTKTHVRLYPSSDVETVTPGTDTATTTAVYDGFGNAIQTIDPNGYSTENAYDAAGKVFRTQRQMWLGTEPSDVPGKGTSLDRSISAAAYDASARTIKTVDAAGNTRQMKYDPLGNVLVEVDERNFVVKGYTYTDDGLPLGFWEPKSDANNLAKLPSYNFGNPNVRVGNTANPRPGGHDLVKFNVYSTSNKRPLPERVLTATGTTTTQPTTSGSGGAETNFEYDFAGRVMKTTLPADEQGVRHIITQEYNEDGEVTSITDADGFTTTMKYDHNNKILEQKQLARAGSTDSNAGLGSGLTSTFEYDVFGNLIEKNERGLITKYAYNSIGKAVAESQPTKPSATSSINWARRGYRLDGELLIKTTTDFQNYYNPIPTAPDQPIEMDTLSGVVNGGNVTGYQLDTNGRIIGEASFGRKRTNGAINDNNQDYDTSFAAQEKQEQLFYNGLNLRVKRIFNGDRAIYAPQRDASGRFILGNGTASTNPTDPNISTAYQTYNRYDNRGKLLEQYDQNAAFTGTSRFNLFRYEYSDTGKEIRNNRNVRVEAPVLLWSNNGNRPADPILGKTVLMAASVGVVVSQYNERDTLEKTVVKDRAPSGIQDLAPETNRVTTYGYYPNGLKKQTSVAPDNNATPLGTVKYTYDQRGREIKVEDDNGAIDTRRDDKGIPRGLQNNISGTATTTTTYKPGELTRIVKDGSNKCYLQQTTINTLANQPYEISEWIYDPQDVSPVAFSCGVSQPTRKTITTYNEQTLPVETNIVNAQTRTVADSYTDFTTDSTAKQTYQYNDYSYETKVNFESTLKSQGFRKGYSCQKVAIRPSIEVPLTMPDPNNPGGPYIAGIPYPDAWLDSTCTAQTQIYQPGSTVPAKDMYDYVAQREGFTSESSKKDESISEYTITGAKTLLKETKNIGLIVQAANPDTDFRGAISAPPLGETTTTQKYILDSSGNRLYVAGGDYDGFVKRYNAIDKPAMYFKWSGGATDPYAAYSDFVYDPSNTQIISSTSGIRQKRIAGNLGYEIIRDTSNLLYSDDDLQISNKRIGRLWRLWDPGGLFGIGMGWKTEQVTDANSYTNPNNFVQRNATYSMADGIVDNTSWTGIVPFSVIPDIGTQFQLEAPQTALSTQVGISPSSITAPTSVVTPPSTGTPSSTVTTPIAPAPVPVVPPANTPPASSPAPANPASVPQSANTNNAPANTTNVTTPTIGVTVTQPVPAPATQPAQAPATQPNVPAATNQPSNPTSNTTPLAPNNAILNPPTSVVPQTLGNTNSSSVTSPQSSSVVPNIGLTPSNVQAPSTSVTPNIGTSPNSSNSNITAPQSTAKPVTGVPTASTIRPPTSVTAIRAESPDGGEFISLLETTSQQAWDNYQTWLKSYFSYSRTAIKQIMDKNNSGDKAIGEFKDLLIQWLGSSLVRWADKNLSEYYSSKVASTIYNLRHGLSDQNEVIEMFVVYASIVFLADASGAHGEDARTKLVNIYGFSIFLMQSKGKVASGKPLDYAGFVTRDIKTNGAWDAKKIKAHILGWIGTIDYWDPNARDAKAQLFALDMFIGGLRILMGIGAAALVPTAPAVAGALAFWGAVDSLYTALAGKDALTGQSVGDLGRILAAGGVALFVFQAANGIRSAMAIGCNSFSAETPVSTIDGQKRIDSLQKTDNVTGFHEYSRKTNEYQVTNTISHTDTTVAKLELETDSGQAETLTTTPEHPFYALVEPNQNSSGVWVNAEKLKTGNWVKRLNGYGVVKRSWNETANQKMYNLTVENAHTFFVGKNDWLVHNTNQGCANLFAVANLDPGDFGRSDKVHFNRANAQLEAQLLANPGLAARLDATSRLIDPTAATALSRVSSTGTRQTPIGFTWHHSLTPGRLELITLGDHYYLWTLNHPGNMGGYAIWAVPAGAPLRRP